MDKHKRTTVTHHNYTELTFEDQEYDDEKEVEEVDTELEDWLIPDEYR